MDIYLFVDIDDINFNNKIKQVSDEIYNQYYYMIVNCKNMKIKYLKFTKMYTKKYYKEDKIFDTLKTFAKDIINIKYLKFINIHVTYSNLLYSILLSRYIRELSKNIIIIFSGVYLSVIQKNLIDIDNSYINYGCRYNKINIEEKIKNEYKLLNNRELLKKYVSIRVGEGCIFKCKYCTFKNMYFGKFTKYDAEYTVEIIRLYHKYYGTEYFLLEHELFINNKLEFIKFYKKIKKLNFKVKWACSSRIEYLDKEVVNLLKEINCNCVFIGLESGSYKIQNKMGKKLRIKEVYNTIKNLAINGVNVIFSFIYLYPDENEKDICETFKLMYNIKEIEFKYKNAVFQFELSKIRFLPNTELTNEYYDKLLFNTKKYNERYPKEIIEFIKENKRLFTDYFDIKENMELENELFEKFVLYLYNKKIYTNYKILMKVIEIYEYNLIKLFEYIVLNYSNTLVKVLNVDNETQDTLSEETNILFDNILIKILNNN